MKYPFWLVDFDRHVTFSMVRTNRKYGVTVFSEFLFFKIFCSHFLKRGFLVKPFSFRGKSLPKGGFLKVKWALYLIIFIPITDQINVNIERSQLKILIAMIAWSQVSLRIQGFLQSFFRTISSDFQVKEVTTSLLPIVMQKNKGDYKEPVLFYQSLTVHGSDPSIGLCGDIFWT